VSTPAGPTRTCVGCRERAPAALLLRVVVRAGALVPDPERLLPGRGAHLHPTHACLDAARRRRAFTRALLVATAPDPAAVVAAVARLDPQPSGPGRPDDGGSAREAGGAARR
jgi:predicted RNA-binding protein YlxR (DUF448 family)